MQNGTKRVNVRKLVMTAMLSAVATVLMFLGFSVPLMPSYLKLEFSELPALIASFSMGPVSGVVVCLVKNLVNVFSTTTGGVDIVAKFLRQKNPHINFGTLILIIDAVIVAAYAVILNKYESAMYSVVAMFVVSKVIDLVLYGIDNSCICYVISEKSQELIDDIISGTMHRGVSILKGEGAYSHQKKQVIMCVIKRTQIAELRKLIRIVDERAFFIVTDAKNVFGNGFENISEVK